MYLWTCRLAICFLFCPISRVSGHWKQNGYFHHLGDTNDRSTAFSKSISTDRKMNRMACVQHCVATDKCNTYFYDKSSKNCVLRKDVPKITKASSNPKEKVIML